MTETTPNTTAPAPITPENWRDLAPEYKEKFPEIKDAAGLFKSYEGALHKMGSPNDYLRRPGKDATAEQQAVFRKELNGFRGVPEKAEYAVTVKDELKPFADETALKEFQPVAHQLGLAPEQVQGIVDYQLGKIAKFVQDSNAAAETSLKNDWGKDYEANGRLSAAFAEKHLSKEYVAAHGVDPISVREMHRLAVKFGEGKISLPDDSGANSKEDLLQKGRDIMARKEYAASEALQKEAKEFYDRAAKM